MFDSSVHDVVAYDTETTGTDKYHDQVLQFAAVYADGEFVQTGAPVDIRIRRLPYVLPSPGALGVTGMDPRTLDDPSLPSEFEAAETVSAHLRTKPGQKRLFVTFNGIQFDDQMLRTMFFRNLLDPYFNNCKDSVRIDVLNLVGLALALDPESLRTENDETGKQSLKLSSLCDANGIGIDAHEGLSDAKATLELLRLVCTRIPQAYKIARRSGMKTIVVEHIQKCVSSARPTWQFERYSVGDVVPSLFIGHAGPSDKPKGSWVSIDLRHPIEDIVEALENISTCTFRQPSPLRRISDAKCPYFLGAEEAAAIPGTMSHPEAVAAVEAIVSRFDPAALREFCSAVTPFDTPCTTSESRIYGNFLTGSEKQKLKDFRWARTWLDRASVDFHDDRLKDFAARILLDTADDSIRDKQAAYIEHYRSQASEALERPWRDDPVSWATVPACRAVMDDLSPYFLDWMEETFSPDQLQEPDLPTPPPVFTSNARGQFLMDL